MAGSIFGNLLKISTWGESHGKGIGVVVDGCPAGLPLTEEDIQVYLDRRKPGQSEITTMRKEEDQIEILSGIFEGQTTGTPISMMVRNTSQRSSDYGEIALSYRPGHADYTYDQKYGFRDYRGGGRSSGRETTARVAGGAVAARLLASLGVQVQAFTRSVGDISIDEDRFDPDEILRNQVYMPDKKAAAQAVALLRTRMKELDSVGGIIECRADGVPAGIGDPVFEKLDARLAMAVMSIGAVKGVEIGEGFHAASLSGSTDNDGFRNHQGVITKTSNHAGGILGGISDGSPIILRAAVKPTPSIFQPQETINQQGENISLSIKGRHDPIIVPRAVVVVECMTALTLADAMLCSMTSRLDRIQKYFCQ